MPEARLEINPADAARLGVTDGDTVRASAEAGGALEVEATVTDRVPEGNSIPARLLRDRSGVATAEVRRPSEGEGGEGLGSDGLRVLFALLADRFPGLLGQQRQAVYHHPVDGTFRISSVVAEFARRQAGEQADALIDQSPPG